MGKCTMQQDKRNTLKILGVMASGMALPFLTSCGSSGGFDSSQPAGTPTPGFSTASGIDWLVGSTDSISVNYPGDDVFALSTPCQVNLFPASTEGPCYYHVAEREDISDGIAALPMQVCLQLIDRQCRPLPGYTVEIWHCDHRGVYSGNSTASSDATRFDLRFCTDKDTAARTSSWGRGERVTNRMGRVNFKSIFPGWYPGRTAHIHFRVKTGKRDSLVSQLRFTDSLCREIYTGHASYSARGNQDTSIRSDFVFSMNDNKGFTLTQNSDGSLLAVKQIQVDI